jgi:predicted transcriptional regulator
MNNHEQDIDLDRELLRNMIRVRLLSVGEFARRAGISEQTLYAILSRNGGDTVRVAPSTARAIVEALDAIEPVISVVIPEQGPRLRERRQVPNN